MARKASSRTAAPPAPPAAAPSPQEQEAGAAQARVNPEPVPALRPQHSGLPIYKMTGSGNDFVMVDARLSSPGDWSPGDIQAICSRGTGVGADGLVFVGPGTQAGAVRMVFFNSDASRAAMCGNAALCTTWLAARLGLAPGSGMRLETDAGVYETRCPDPHAGAELQVPSLAPAAEAPTIPPGPGEHRIALATVGVPHLVVVVDDVDAVDLATRGRVLRSHPAVGPAGANVNFISPASTADTWRMRTFERGVEGETLACGTGAVAAACALSDWGLASLPVTIMSRSGQPLSVRARRSRRGVYEDVWLSGQARLVFRGVLG